MLLLATPIVGGRIVAKEMPDELSRFNPAGLSQEWQYEGTAFRALPNPRSGRGDVAIFRLYHTQRGFLLTASASEVSAAERQGFMRQGVAFYAPIKSDVPVYRFRSATNGSFYYSVDRREAASMSSGDEEIAFYAADLPSDLRSTVADTDGATVPVSRYKNSPTQYYLFTAGRESRYRIGVFYFSSFSSSAKNIINGTRKVYGRENDWWGGVKDFYGNEPGIRQDTRGWGGDWSDLKPAIGYYDQKSVATLEKHIQQASDAGLSFFSFYWYWSNAKHGELYPEGLASFLHARNANLLRFNLSLYAHPWDDDMAITPDIAPEIVKNLVSYFKDPKYLRLPDGRPIFVIGDDSNIRLAKGEKCSTSECHVRAMNNFLGLLKQVSIQTLGVAPFVQIQAGAPAWADDKALDGITCLTPPYKIGAGTPYPYFTQEIFAPLADQGKPVSPCMLENFDERPRQDIVIPDRSAMLYFVGKTDTLFRHNLEVAKQFADTSYLAHSNPASLIVYLYAWNEWHEGGIIEPTAHSGARTLNTVTDVFQLPRVASPCLDRGQCDSPVASAH